MESVTFKPFDTLRSKLIVCLWILLSNGVFGVEAVEEVRKVEGESATLHSGVKEYQRIIWLFGPQQKIMAQCWGNASGNPSCKITDQRLKDRLKTDDPTGSLTINNIRNEDAGHYHLQIFNNLPDKEFNVIVSEPGSDRGYIAQICVPLVLVVLVLGGIGVTAWICWKKRQDKQNKMGSFRVMRGTEEQSPGDERSSLEIDEGS